MTEKKRRKTSATGNGDKDGGWGKFTLFAPEANHVFLAGEFNHWDTPSLPMKRDKDGVWKISLKLSPGRYDYKLFADNTWVEDIPGAESTSNPTVSLGTYTNSMMYRFAENLNARADITMSYSPYSTFADKYGSAPQGLNGIHLSRAEINYRPWENVSLQVQYRQLPFGGYYSPFYDTWHSPFGY